MSENPCQAKCLCFLHNYKAKTAASLTQHGTDNVPSTVVLHMNILQLSYRCCGLNTLQARPWWQDSWSQHGAHLRPTGPRWAPCWPHELCYLGMAAFSQTTFSNAFSWMKRYGFRLKLVQIIAWHRTGDKPLSEPMLVSLLTHICVTRPEWDKGATDKITLFAYPI